MEYEKIKQLIDDMGESKLTSLEIDFPDGTKISMRKGEKEVTVKMTENGETSGEINGKHSSEIDVSNNLPHEEDLGGNLITSPMVGTFYSKPSPDSEPYVEVGSHIKKGDVVCIVEAMKLMNEIESEFEGEIVEVLVKNGEPVEYGKPLFRVK